MGPTAPLTPYGQLPFFIETLKVVGRLDALVADCPLAYTSPNALEKRNVLGTTMFSVLAGINATLISRPFAAMTCSPSCWA